MDFRFDRVFHNNCTQKDIFESVAHVVQGVLEGFNGSLMAYGQTSSGKTHTMQVCHHPLMFLCLSEIALLQLLR